MRRLLLMAVAAAVPLAGCTAATPIPPVTPLATDQGEAWAAVLRDNVDEAGRVAFRRLRDKPEPLDLAVAVVATAQAPGPRDARLAFEINSYNTLAMHDVLLHGVPQRLGLLDRADFFRLTRFTIAGRTLSLHSYENDVIRAEGDPRVHFALNCMSVSCPRLPRTPFSATDLDAQLDAAARQFMAEPRNVRYDPATRTVYLSALLSFYTADFLRAAPSLLAYVNRYRTEPVPEDAAVAFVPYDWTINDQPGDETVPP